MNIELVTQTEHFALVKADEMIVPKNILQFAEACYALGYLPMQGWGANIMCIKLSALPGGVTWQ